MNILALLRERFADALQPFTADPAPYLEMVKVAGDTRHGDFQANCALALQKERKAPPRELAAQLAGQLKIDDFCEPPEIAGPGFINIKLKDSWIARSVTSLVHDQRLGVPKAGQPKTVVIDYSGPNVAKPMHVGHLRSTVIGAALVNVLSFLGHQVIGDNHIGDWGTQFGMIIYGYRNFLDEAAYQQNPVGELARLYRLVNQLEGYYKALAGIPATQEKIRQAEITLMELRATANEKDKAAQKRIKKQENSLAELREELASLQKKQQSVELSPQLMQLAQQHPDIQTRTREETVRLHGGDAENKQLWDEIMRHCLASLDEMYQRLGIHFDTIYGESWYNPMLADVVADLQGRGIARETSGAVGVFLNENSENEDERNRAFLIRKADGAFNYGTTDLATLKHRIEQQDADVILYVVGTPQSEHFSALFQIARLWGYDQAEMVHVNFGSVLDENRQIFRTRAGDTVGLESLIDEAVSRAGQVVAENSPELSPEEQTRIAEIVGIGGIKFADLYHSRESDYVFNWEKMLATRGDSGTYIQYAYARCSGIFRKGNVDREAVRNSGVTIQIATPEERALALQLCRLEEVLGTVVRDYRPNLIADYLLQLTKNYSQFFSACPVLKAETVELKTSRLLLCDLTARMIELGLGLLGIQVSERM